MDGLKLVNDTLGHDFGDSVPAAAAGVIRETFREGDMVARIGGDEFAVLLPGAGRNTVENAGQRIREAVARHNRTNPGLPLSISVGPASSDGDTVYMNNLFKEADRRGEGRDAEALRDRPPDSAVGPRSVPHRRLDTETPRVVGRAD